ncbi:hypothetical protein J7337_003175 [Fusarium musae]|uniref:Uncharacterized protein n=1 Tax=Fusarium musae TaxID=1042133 RepID=A0A9P8IUE5_9HYPO|nr:hypothetical protein J7337_003175 [Fusarium musae]KAG9506194.1 hypothetical protein J7337_003175 [Fusarium musae]
MGELEAQMNSPLDFHGQKVVIRIAEQPWFNDNNSEDHNTEDHMPMQRVLWEFLERLEVWEPTMRPMEVSVVQTLATGTPELLDQDEKENGAAGPENEGQRRVLVLLAYCSTGGRKFYNVILKRPGSFRALKTELESHPKGYFTIIHLDMLLVHKRPRKSEPGTRRIYFQFVNQNKSEVIEGDLKAAIKVAALLLLHGVQDVVIAPCPHARSAIETAATVLLSSGIRTVVALAYHITEIDAGVFIRSLYTGYIHEKLPLEEAARAARRHLRGIEGDEKPICDFVALTIHTFAWKAAAAIDLWNGWHWKDGSVGSFMYMVKGFGPSESFNKDDMLQQLQHRFVPNSTLDSDDTSSFYEYFESHKCLIVIDDLDSANFNRQQGQFMDLTSKLSKSGALVILASRKRERWLTTLLVMDPEFRDRVTDNDEPSSPETTAKNKAQE